MAKWDKPLNVPSPSGGGGGQPQPAYGGGVSNNPGYGSDPSQAGVLGESNTGPGVMGRSVHAVFIPGSGESDGVLGESNGNGVHGISNGAGAGVWGESRGGGYGLKGFTTSTYQADPHVATPGVFGLNYGTGAGVLGFSNWGDGVWGASFANDHAAVSAVNYGGGFGVWASATIAGHFEGDVEVNGNINHNKGNLNLNNGLLNIGSSGDLILSDCAEPFDVADEKAEPGSVMVIDEDGKLRQCARPYDKTVAGVVSGAGNLRPGIILGRQESGPIGMPIALLGKVCCKVDADRAPIQVGDLLTTSNIQGHAMKAEDPKKAFGAVIGKALGSLMHGRGMIPILVALQ